MLFDAMIIVFNDDKMSSKEDKNNVQSSNLLHCHQAAANNHQQQPLRLWWGWYVGHNKEEAFVWGELSKGQQWAANMKSHGIVYSDIVFRDFWGPTPVHCSLTPLLQAIFKSPIKLFDDVLVCTYTLYCSISFWLYYRYHTLNDQLCKIAWQVTGHRSQVMARRGGGAGGMVKSRSSWTKLHDAWQHWEHTALSQTCEVVYSSTTVAQVLRE